MSRAAEIRLFFGEGEFDFALRCGQLQQLEENRGRALAGLGFSPGEASAEKVLMRLAQGGTLVSDVKEVLRLGLVGAGMEKSRAWALVERHVEAPHIKECGTIACAVLQAALVGVPDDKPGEPEGEAGGAGTTRPVSPTDGGAGATSTGTPQP